MLYGHKTKPFIFTKNHSMIKSFLFSLISLFVFELQAQPFQPDEFGNVGGPKFKAFITKRGYKLVGNFYKISVGEKSMLAAKVLKGNQWIFIDVDGKEIESPGEMLRKEQNIPEIPHPDAFPVPGPDDWKIEKLKSIQSPKGKGMIYDSDTLAQAIYQEIASYPAYRILIIKKDNKYGAIDETGKLVIPVEYERLSPTGEKTGSFCYYAGKNGKSGFLSCTNQVSIPFEFNTLNYRKTYIETQVRVPNGPPLRGVISLEGKEILPAVYTGIDASHDGCFIVSTGRVKNRIIGMTDRNGKFILDTIYSDYHSYSLNKFLIQFEQPVTPHSSQFTSGIFDLRTNQFVLSPGKYSVSRIIYQYGRDVIHRTNKGYLHGWASMTGKLLIEPAYEELNATWDSPFLIVKKDGKYGIIDSTGKTLLPFKYEKLDHFGPYSFEGYLKRGDVFVITEGTKQGVITINGKLIIPIEYESVQTTSDGIICIKEGVSKVMNLEGRVYFQTTEFRIGEFDLEYGFVKTRNFHYDLYGNKLATGK